MNLKLLQPHDYKDNFRWSGRGVLEANLPGKGDVRESVPTTRRNDSQTVKKTTKLKWVCVFFLPGEGQKLQNAEKQSETLVFPLQRHTNIRYHNSRRAGYVSQTADANPKQLFLPRTRRTTSTPGTPVETHTISDSVCNTNLSVCVWVCVWAHQHDDGRERTLFSTHVLDLLQRPHQEHGAGTTRTATFALFWHHRGGRSLTFSFIEIE